MTIPQAMAAADHLLAALAERGLSIRDGAGVKAPDADAREVLAEVLVNEPGDPPEP